MAYDKVIDSIKLNNDLTSIANAIRTKGETSEKLIFPEGFISNINAISTGAELNFEVVGGTSQPTNPIENTIWVNTDISITKYIFSTAQPLSAIEGEVWINTDHSSTTPFNCIKDSNIIISLSPSYCSQYINGQWVFKNALAYQNGVWNSWIMVLFENGKTHELADKFVVTRYGLDKIPAENVGSISSTVLERDGILKYEIIYDSGSDGGIRTLNPIDITGYDRIEFEITHNQQFYYGYNYFGACKKEIGTLKDFDAYKSLKNEFSGTLTVDTSQLVGEYYIGVLCQGRSDTGRVDIKKITLLS